jgi:hypothetical protein
VSKAGQSGTYAGACLLCNKKVTVNLPPQPQPSIIHQDSAGSQQSADAERLKEVRLPNLKGGLVPFPIKVVANVERMTNIKNL